MIYDARGLKPVFIVALYSWVASGAPPVDYQRDIQPILAKRCFACHGPDEQARQANLRLDSWEAATGKTGGLAGIIPGNSGQSRVVARITAAKRPMPPTGEPLSSREVELVRAWIEQGAGYRKHWSLEEPVRPDLPAVRHAAWPRNAIDRFVLARLEQEGRKPSGEASPYILARRVAMDLTGLPPDPAAVVAFARDASEKAYERLVDSLLASPQYGERWARVWLDLARYADSQGYEKDRVRHIWPYRDWVVRALNENMPFDRFTVRQLAGDLLPNATQSDLIATAFHRNTMTNTEGGSDDEEFRDAAIKDRVATTGQVWMGMTWGCAQCHTHKYDPLSHREFFQLYAFFNQTEDSDKEDERPVLSWGKFSMPIMRELPADKQRRTRQQLRGSFLNPGEDVQPGVPAAFPPVPAGAPVNRLGLAQWLVDSRNPLTARVLANRLWARLFGRGLVDTEEDFGSQGNPPSHPQLLDWLATEVHRVKWDLKAVLKTMVMSATYRQSSDVTPEGRERDPGNVLLSRGPRFRMEAEMVRDQALAVSGLLSRKMGGPPVMPWQPEGIWNVVYNTERWLTSAGEDRYRRCLYTFLRRSSPYPMLAAYDAPAGLTCTLRRIRTNTPLQALAAMNDPGLMEAAQHLAARAMSEAGETDRARAEWLFRRVLVRPPSAAETTRLVQLRREAEAELRQGRGSAPELLHYSEVLYAGDRTVALVAKEGTERARWRYALESPGDGWQERGFSDAGWLEGAGPFGYFERESDIQPATKWDVEQLWLRRTFTVEPER